MNVAVPARPVVTQNVPDDDDDDDDDDDVLVSPDAIVFDNNPKLTLEEAFNRLSPTQKRYFKRLTEYANAKPNAKIKESRSSLTIAAGNKSYIKLSIKKDTVVATFSLEDEEMQRLRLNGELSVKQEKTKIKIIDDNALDAALKMIDVRELQIDREIELIKERRRERQRQNRKNN